MAHTPHVHGDVREDCPVCRDIASAPADAPAAEPGRDFSAGPELTPEQQAREDIKIRDARVAADMARERVGDIDPATGRWQTARDWR